ncbi:MAG: SIR2 family protein [Thermoplasmata archaeon]|nr:SIR2 family protein [Thermoplasmata archaeon]
MSGESSYPEDLLPSNMFSMKRSPVLWIGSGISKRFAENFRTWDGLLSDVASRFGVDPDTYTALKLEASMEVADPDTDRDLVYMKTASKLSARLVSMFADGTLRPRDLLSEDELDQYRHGVDPFKLLVCSGMGKAAYREERREEIECFAELRDSVPAVVTTNYDTVVEDLFGSGFKVFNDVDEYYAPDSIGMGEIYKIHGTVRMPRGIVITERDHRRFESRRPIVSAKILSLMCEAPLLILGHSADDRIVRDSIRDMFNGFSREKASEVARNIVFIQYREGASPERGVIMIESSNGAIPVQMVVLDDMLPIFRDASRHRRTLTVGQIRMLRRMMSDVSLTADPNNDPRMAYAGIEGIDDVDPNRTVIALTSRVYLDAARSFSSFSIDDIIRDVLGSRSLPAESVVKVWFEERRQGGMARTVRYSTTWHPWNWIPMSSHPG